MKARAVSRRFDSRVQLLIADDDAGIRALLAARVLERNEAIAILEADDGATAVRVGLLERPHIAILDINMPNLDGIDAALALRALAPTMRLALQTADPRAHRNKARAHHLPLFDKLELGRVLSWVEVQVEACAVGRRRPRSPHERARECSSCGYGIACSTPPTRCPMCHAHDSWIQRTSRRDEPDAHSCAAVGSAYAVM